MIKKLIKKVISWSGYTIVRQDVFSELQGGKDFVSLYQTCRPYTMVPQGRTFGLYKAVEYIAANNIEGDVVECGVWRGGQSMVIAKTLLKLGDTKRSIWMYDTYAGMSEPTEVDVQAEAGRPADVDWRDLQKDSHNEWCYAPLEDVKRNMLATKYPQDKIIYVEGKVEDTIPAKLPAKIALLRLDTDWYESTYHELTHLLPLLSVGGILIIDDYQFWSGAKKAVDEYFAKHDIPFTLLDVDGGKFGIKLCQPR